MAIAPYYAANGVLSGDAASPSTISGNGAKNRLVSGNEDGSANTDFQRLYGGGGSDTFQLRFKDFDHTTDTAELKSSKTIADFGGAQSNSYEFSNNDFISLTGFEGEVKSLKMVGSYDATAADAAIVYTYQIIVDGDVQGTFKVNSVNGKELSINDYNFY